MKKLIILIILTMSSIGFSQSYYDSQKQNREYKSLQQSTSRAFAVPERQSTNTSSYQSSSSSSVGSSSSNSSSSGNSNSSSTSSTNNDNYSWGSTGRYEREQKERAASDAKNQKLLDAYEAKVSVIKNCFKTLGKIKDNYEKICNCALSNGVDYNTTYRVVGFSADQFQMNIDRENGITGVQLNTSQANTKQNVFSGTIISGKKVGKGKFIKDDGTIEEGEYIDDLLNGYATVVYPNGRTYEGYVVNGQRSGKGKVTWKDGSFMEGTFFENKLNGIGRLNFKNSMQYEGNFVKNYYEGKGKLTYANGEVYEGEFLKGKLNGIGKQIKKSGYYSAGTYKDDIPEKVKYYNPLNEKISKSEYDKN